MLAKAARQVVGWAMGPFSIQVDPWPTHLTNNSCPRFTSQINKTNVLRSELKSFASWLFFSSILLLLPIMLQVIRMKTCKRSISIQLASNLDYNKIIILVWEGKGMYQNKLSSSSMVQPRLQCRRTTFKIHINFITYKQCES